MTKDEIKKALECCISYKDGMCKQCPNYDYDEEDCADNLKRQALDLITEQENEIDLLQMQMKDVVNHADTFLAEATKFEAENKKLKAENKMRLINLNTALDDIKQAKIDVLNELKEFIYDTALEDADDIPCGITYIAIDVDKFEQGIDEMIEELKK